MSKLKDALRKKFKTPREAILALGLDESLLTERAYDSATLNKENTMSKKDLLSRRGTVAYGALLTFVSPQLAMDAKIDLRKPLHGLTAQNFKAKRGALARSIEKAVAGKLAEDAAPNFRMGLDAVLDMVEKADKPAEDEDMEDEDADMAAEDEEDDDGKEMPESDDRKKGEKMDAKAKDKKAKDKKPMAGVKGKDKKFGKDKDVNEEDEEHDPETSEEMADDEDDEMASQAMDAAIRKGVEEGVRAERLRMEAISEAKEHVRPRVGSLSMAFDSAGDVYRRALKMVTGKEPPKKADAATLKYAFDNLPPKDGAGQRQTYAMDSSNGGTGSMDSIAARNPILAKNINRIGRA